MIFKKMGTCHVVVDYSGTPNPKFYFDLLLFTWRRALQGLRRPLKSQKGLKSTAKMFLYIFIEAKIEEKLEHNIFY